MAEVKVDNGLVGLKDVYVHVEDHGGSGRPVMLIHGWPLSQESWKYQIMPLSDAGYRVITYDRRGFGRSDKPKTGYDYDTLAGDLAKLIEKLELTDISLVGFSMGGGEVARYVANYGEKRLRSVVFAAAIPPMMMKFPNNPDGPLKKSKATAMTTNLIKDAASFYDRYTKDFFSPNADGKVLVSEEQRQEALRLCKQADKIAALEAMQSFGVSDFRNDLPKITIPTLIIHGDADGIVPLAGSGKRIHAAIPHSEMHIISGGPHGIAISHTYEFNNVLLRFLTK